MGPAATRGISLGRAFLQAEELVELAAQEDLGREGGLTSASGRSLSHGPIQVLEAPRPGLTPSAHPGRPSPLPRAVILGGPVPGSPAPPAEHPLRGGPHTSQEAAQTLASHESTAAPARPDVAPEP